tara:strand:+ start:665187 stop:666263 length:1077 start_codon:yes stop_codon:yes gene_type:complete
MLLMLCVTLSACASPSSHYKTASKTEIDGEIKIQKTMAFEQKRKEEEHVGAIAHKILTSNAQLCDTQHKDLGFTLWNAYFNHGEDREIAQTLYDLDHVYQVKYVYAGSHAAEQDIRVGDKIIAINEIDISSKKTSLTALTKALNHNNSDKVDKAIRLILLRGDQQLYKDIRPVLICPYSIRYDEKSMEINAYADGKMIIVTRGLYRFAQTDNELALVLGHELGHNIMKHNIKSSYNQALAELSTAIIEITVNSTGYKMPDILTNTIRTRSARVNSVEFEREADYTGLYMSERAGYDTAQAINFWRRMAVEFSASNISKRSTHPATAERFIYLEKTYQEILAKKNSGQELRPNLKANAK